MTHIADVRAERIAFLARTKEAVAKQGLRTRAKLLLTNRWNASEEELRAVISLEYPGLSEEEVAELLSCAMELQRTDRPRIDPRSVMVKPLELEPGKKRKLLRSVSIFTPAPDALPPVEAESSTPEEVEVAKPVGTTTVEGDLRERIRKYVRAELVKDPDLTASKLLPEVNRRFRVDIKEANFYITYLTPMRKSLGITGQHKKKISTPAVTAAPAKALEEQDREGLNRVLNSADASPEEKQKARARLLEMELSDEQSDSAAGAAADSEPPGLVEALSKGSSDVVFRVQSENGSSENAPPPPAASAATGPEHIRLDQVEGEYWLRVNLCFDDLEEGVVMLSGLLSALRTRPLAAVH